MTPTQLSQFGVALGRVCQRFGVTTTEIEEDRRFARVVLVRHLLMWYARSIGIKTGKIALLLNRSPGDVSHGFRAFQNRLETEPKIREIWDWLRNAEQ